MNTTIRAIFVLLLIATTAAAQPNALDIAFPDGMQRIWPGPELFTNRHLDWQLANGRLECVEGSTRKPMRTAHILTRRLSSSGEAFTLRVRTGPIAGGGQPHENTWTGFHIGAGGDHVDYRTSALAHHWPAEDGGLIAAFDGMNRIVFRDNAHTRGPRAPRPNIPVSAWPALNDPQAPSNPRIQPEVVLELHGEPGANGYEITLTATNPESGDTIASATLENVNESFLDGNVALISHTSPNQDGPGYWFDDVHASGPKLDVTGDHAFGPIVSAMYTLSRGTLKLTAQMTPLGDLDMKSAALEVQYGGEWRAVAQGTLQPHSFTIPFRVTGYDADVDRPYRVVYHLNTGDDQEVHHYQGTIRKEPLDQQQIKVAAFTGHHISARGKGHWNGNHIWYPHNELVDAVEYHDPDFLFFSGDQIYEGGLAGIVREPADEACIDYLYHWYRWCLAFRDLTRERPAVAIPDDHDVYHGNIWGAGGKATIDEGSGKERQDSGGYRMDPVFVNAVHRTQTSHLPDPVDPAPIKQGITTYHTGINYGGISFAVIADRMWKDSPSVMVPEGVVVNGWFEAPGFDIKNNSDVPDATLLGERQLNFLEDWTQDWSNHSEFKVLLSQTIFANVATLPAHAINDTVVPGMEQPSEPGEYMEGDKIVADGDSNGWPQTARNNALGAIRKGFTFHIAGDQHLGSFIHYGVDDWNDAGYAFCVPSVANVWPRRWFPPEPGANREPGSPKYTGEFEDGFGNKITVHAVSNPGPSGHEPSALYDRAPGYGIAVFDKATREITAANWPRWVDPSTPDAQPYPGWPITVKQNDNYGREAVAHLPQFTVKEEDPVVQVIRESNGDVQYTLRINGTTFTPHVFHDEPHTIIVRYPEDNLSKTINDVEPGATGPITVSFD